MKFLFLLVFAQAYLPDISCVNSKNWCENKVNCPRNNSTLVNFRYERDHCPLNNTCDRVGRRVKISYLSKMYIVRFLNQYKKYWCECKESIIASIIKEKDIVSDGNFQCAFMNVISWHDELAQLSQCVTNTCYEHFENVRNEHFPNITCTDQSSILLSNFELRGREKLEYKKLKKLIMTWYPNNGRREDYLTVTPNIVKYVRFDMAAWLLSTTKYIGCAVTSFQRNKLYFVCFYDHSPTIGGVLLVNGKLAEKCPKDMPAHVSYRNLCGISNHVLNVASKINDVLVIVKTLYVVLLTFLT